MLDRARWKETEGSKHVGPGIINSFIPDVNDSRLEIQQNLPPTSPDKVSEFYQ